MKVSKVCIKNIDLLYNAAVEIETPGMFKDAKFGRNYTQLLNNVAITLTLENVSRLDILFLEMYATSVVVWDDNRFYDLVDLGYIDFEYKEIYKTGLEQLISFIESVEDDIDCPDRYKKMFLPMGCLTTSVTVTLTGNQVANIIGIDPGIFFTIGTKGKCRLDENGKSGSLIPGYDIYHDNDFIDHIIKTFINNFYKFMIGKASYNDILSDSFNYQNFLSKPNEKNNVVFCGIRNPLFLVDMQNDGNETIISSLNDYKKKGVNKDVTVMNTYLTFAISSSFATFVDIMTFLPYEKFTCMESLNIPFSASLDNTNIPKCPEELVSKYERRFNGRLKAFIDAVNNTYSTDDKVMKKIQMTQGYVRYNYCITVSLKDMDLYIDHVLKTKNDIRFKSLVDLETMDIFNKILKYALTIFKSLT